MSNNKAFPPPDSGTESCKQYFVDSKAIVSLLGFVLETVMHSDFVVAVARQALEGPENLKIRSPGELAREAPGPRTLHIRKHSQLFLELFLARLVDNFQCYIVGIIREVLSVQPRVLVNAQPTLSLEYVFQFQTLDDLRADVVEAKVNDLSYQGFQALKQWCLDRRIPIAVSSDMEPKLVELISIRNIIAHNRGVVDKKFIRSIPTGVYPLGTRRNISVDELFEAVALLDQVVALTDAAIQQKFDLQCGPIVQTEKD